MPTPWQLFKKKWQDCLLCEYGPRRNKIVLAKGKIPCDVLFIGEAPGKGEDSRGIPFDGEAGTRVLDPIIELAFDGYENVRIAFTNILACIPKDETGRKVGTGAEISKKAIKACSARLDDFVRACSPKAIVWVGGLAAKHGPRVEYEDLLQVEITHPAAILRANKADQGMAMQNCVAKIRSLLYDLTGE